jgi:hypothetical protein
MQVLSLPARGATASFTEAPYRSVLLEVAMLHEFIIPHRDEIIRRCRAKVAQRSVPRPTTVEINHGVPPFLDQLADALRLGRGSSAAIARSADRRGVGLGLAFSRWGVEANDGRLGGRDIHGVGCVFPVDLPRLALPALAVT